MNSDNLNFIYIDIDTFCKIKNIKRRNFFYKKKNKEYKNYEFMKRGRKTYIKINTENELIFINLKD